LTNGRYGFLVLAGVVESYSEVEMTPGIIRFECDRSSVQCDGLSPSLASTEFYAVAPVDLLEEENRVTVLWIVVVLKKVVLP
jgi:hypothetical protein